MAISPRDSNPGSAGVRQQITYFYANLPNFLMIQAKLVNFAI
jgi:hypothetical protein